MTSQLLELADPPTALFAGNNIMALGIVAELARSKRKDVAVVAFDDVSLAEALEPALTVVAQDPEEIGRSAAATALTRLDGDRSRARTITVPTQLIVRGSGSNPRPRRRRQVIQPRDGGFLPPWEGEASARAHPGHMSLGSSADQ